MKNHSFLFAKVSLGLFFSFMALMATAQSGIVRGKVKGPDGNGLGGASISVQGSTRGTTAAPDGSYSLSITTGTHTIIATYVGFTTARQSVTVGNGQTVDLDFNLAESGLGEEVVVTGSRALARTRTETPVPVDVIPVSQVINDIGQVDLNQILNFIAPSFQ